MSAANKNVIWFEDLSRGDVGLVGGKNSSLGEMVQQLGEKGIDVPPWLRHHVRRLPRLHQGQQSQ
jgi:pyruvate,water dikinase